MVCSARTSFAMIQVVYICPAGETLSPNHEGEQKSIIAIRRRAPPVHCVRAARPSAPGLASGERGVARPHGVTAMTTPTSRPNFLGPNERDNLTVGRNLQITDFMHDAVFQRVIRVFSPGVSEKLHSPGLGNPRSIGDYIANTSLVS